MTSKIIIVDDKQSVLDFLELVFQRHGFEVIKTANGAKAVDLAAEILPDIMLVDVMMPEVDGLEVCRRLRANPTTQDLTILLYSSAVGDEIRTRVREAGGDAFLGKTMNHAELLTQVRNWMLARADPGGVGEPALLKVARDIGVMLEVELVWLLRVGETGLSHLAISDHGGEQQARRFLEVAGKGPFSLDPEYLFGYILQNDELRLSVPVSRIKTTKGGKRLGQAMAQFSIQKISFAPLRDRGASLGLMIFSGLATLEASPHDREMVSAAARYACAAIAAWGG